ncbi:MAG: maleylpyruvate isomerase N-terminal domain-containing protein [Nocardioides sp.]|nr:maleylpyruvate isomerase N-terminal domain-containing protein [Nocardioides sp.]
MDVEDQWTHIEAARRSLAALLEGLSPAQWEAPSLCSEWRVRDVAALLLLTTGRAAAARAQLEGPGLALLPAGT